jgi:hypothetical protein
MPRNPPLTRGAISRTRHGLAHYAALFWVFGFLAWKSPPPAYRAPVADWLMGALSLVLIVLPMMTPHETRGRRTRTTVLVAGLCAAWLTSLFLPTHLMEHFWPLLVVLAVADSMFVPVFSLQHRPIGVEE